MAETAVLVGSSTVLLPFDWLDPAECLYWQARGKVGVWFDYLALWEMGGNGAWLERELAGWGIVVYAALIVQEGDGLLAQVLVDRKHEQRVRKWFAKLGILL